MMVAQCMKISENETDFFLKEKTHFFRGLFLMVIFDREKNESL